MIENRNLDEVRAGRAGGFTLEVKFLNSARLSFGAACAFKCRLSLRLDEPTVDFGTVLTATG
jgi:hypothetical protein